MQDSKSPEESTGWFTKITWPLNKTISKTKDLVDSLKVSLVSKHLGVVVKSFHYQAHLFLWVYFLFTDEG